MLQPQGRFSSPPVSLVLLVVAAPLTLGIGACNGARHDRLPLVVPDGSVDAATDARADVARPDAVRPDVVRADVATDVTRDTAPDASDGAVGDVADSGDVQDDAADAGDASDSGDDASDADDASGADDTSDTGDDASDAGDDVPDAGDDVFDAGDEDAGLPPGPPLIQVMLGWDGPGDLDLHLHNGNATPWFTANDAWAAQPMPSWGLAGTDDDGWLFVQNNTGYGPEWVQVQTPHSGERYVVGVHDADGGAGRIASVQIWCGVGTVQVPFTMTSRALVGGDTGGGCNGNDFWIAASVVIDGSGACNITPIDAYESAAAACATVP